MPLFRLERYPYVCRLCLKPEQHRKMTSLDTVDESLEGASFEDFLASITFEVEEEKRHLFPRSICPPCKDLLRAFGRFYVKVRRVHLFMNALVELRDLNTDPLRVLFATPSTRPMLMELDLCQTDQVRANDLIGEFPQFKIASLPATVSASVAWVGVKSEVEPPAEVAEDSDSPQEEVEKGDGEELEHPAEGGLFAEECSPEELKELTNAVKADASQEMSDEPFVKWEFLDDSDEEMAVPKKVPPRRKVVVAKKPKPKPKPKPQCENIDWDSWIANPPTTAESLKDRQTALPKQHCGEKSAKPIQCPKCPFKTVYKAKFHRHQLTHLKRENFRFTCKEPGCSAQFHDRRYLAAHVEKKHRTWICEICGQICKDRNYLKLHKIRSHAENPPTITCQYCPRSFKFASDLRTHVRHIHLAECTYKCDTCGLEFKRKTTLDTHKLRHLDVYNFPCQQCDKKFKDNNSLRKHYKRAHQEPGFECEHCRKLFYTRGILLNHIEEAHGIQMRFTCDICVEIFDSQAKLAAHKDCHENPKMFQCGRCLLVFSAQEPFVDHICITYRDDYVCCGRDFKDHKPYNRHMFLKHGTKVNVRVRPEAGVLLGQVRARRKRMEICQKCDACFPTRILKKQHQETCLAGEIKF